MTSNRSDKVSDLLKKEISTIITNDIKDPRLQNINITAVKVSDDIGIATVFYTVIGKSISKSESDIDKKVLNKLSGMIRSNFLRILRLEEYQK
jgi:ribosome-binding factor A